MLIQEEISVCGRALGEFRVETPLEFSPTRLPRLIGSRALRCRLSSVKN